ncbi:MAG: insulinase family protein [Marinilabiliales bacterium]|nr:MAG: insulinase family protein [Marinilabiliales bacterium]
MTFHTHEFDNGIRIIHFRVPSQVAHCGLYINAGSRDEEPGEHGIAHFIEHLFFKGTKKRRAHHIISRLEAVGGEINAYTGKEETCIYSSFMREDFERSLELICDMTFHSVFPEKELNREKQVIIDEILSYMDNPAEQIFDDFEEIVFCNDPIGRNILGTPKHLMKFNRDDIIRFMNNNYRTDQMVFASVGDHDFNSVLRYARKHLEPVTANRKARIRQKHNTYHPASRILSRKTHQVHFITGKRAFNMYDGKRMTMVVLNNILGGPGMSARLNQALRERSGFAYNVESHYTAWSDTGIFNVYFGCDRDKTDRCRHLLRKEFSALRNKRLSPVQLNRAKRQLKGQLAIGWESRENLMMAIGKSYLLFNRVDTVEEVYRKIDAVTAMDIMDVANYILDPGSLSELVYT